MQNLKTFFGQTFKIDELWKMNDDKPDDVKKEQRVGSREKTLMTCVGVGYFNINKNLL